MSEIYYVRTQYDGHDYRSVLEIYYFDEDGEEQANATLTDLCMDISTCADQGNDTWSYIKNQVRARLEIHKIDYEKIECGPDFE